MGLSCFGRVWFGSSGAKVNEAAVKPARRWGQRMRHGAHALLLAANEVQTGIGRCGRAFAHELFGIEPDPMTLAKGIGGGVPLAALLCEEAFNCFAPGYQGGKYGGTPMMAAAGAERGAGLLRILVLPTDTAAQVVAQPQALYPVGLLINAPRPNLLRFMPALTISDDEIDPGMQLLRRALHAAMG